MSQRFPSFLLLIVIFSWVSLRQVASFNAILPCRRNALLSRDVSIRLEQTPSHEDTSEGNFFQRRNVLRRVFVDAPSIFIALGNLPAANAAPPFAIMAEEMGYFPVMDERTGQTVMVPAKAKRESTEQAIALAKYLQSTGTKMYGAFWCPHCQRQKELFGKEAWKYVSYVECSPKGYRSEFAQCIDNGVDGYPTWKFGNGKDQGGEMELIDIAKTSGYLNKRGAKFDANLEGGVPPLGGASCQ